MIELVIHEVEMIANQAGPIENMKHLCGFKLRRTSMASMIEWASFVTHSRRRVLLRRLTAGQSKLL